MMNEEKINLIIWGCNPFSKQLYHFIEGSTIEVIAFITEDNNQIESFCNKRVFTAYTFKALKDYRDVPIVIANHRTMFFKRPLLRQKHITQFKKILQEISTNYQIENQLLHPAALTDFLPLRVQHKPILFGLQGAGNVIFNQIFLNICKAEFPLVITRDKRTFFFEMLCREYLQIIQQIILDHIHLNEGHTVHHIAWKIGTSHFNFLFGKNNIPCSIYTFQTRDHIAQFTAMYHQIPSLTYLQKLQSMRFKIFFISRNPLDMILSGIKKSGGINEVNGDINMHHFYATANWVINQLNDWHHLTKSLCVLRYEDLLNSPVKTIKFMMKQLHLLPFSSLAKKIWRAVKFKQLSHAFKNHFWQGGSGKWELFFKQEHLMILKALGIERILLNYHYSDIYEKFNKLTETFSQNEISSFARSVSLLGVVRDGFREKALFRTEECEKSFSQRACPCMFLGACPCMFLAGVPSRTIPENETLRGYLPAESNSTIYRDEHYDTFQFLKEMHGEKNCVKCGPLFLVCHDHETLQHLVKILDLTYLKKIILSGAHESYRIV